MKVIPDFLNEIQALDSRFSIVDNPNYKTLKNIFFEGKNWDLPPIPAEEIKDDPDPTYFHTFVNGYETAYYSRNQVIEKLKEFLEDLPNRRKIYED